MRGSWYQTGLGATPLGARVNTTAPVQDLSVEPPVPFDTILPQPTAPIPTWSIAPRTLQSPIIGARTPLVTSQQPTCGVLETYNAELGACVPHIVDEPPPMTPPADTTPPPAATVSCPAGSVFSSTVGACIPLNLGPNLFAPTVQPPPPAEDQPPYNPPKKTNWLLWGAVGLGVGAAAWYLIKGRKKNPYHGDSFLEGLFESKPPRGANLTYGEARKIGEELGVATDLVTSVYTAVGTGGHPSHRSTIRKHFRDEGIDLPSDDMLQAILDELGDRGYIVHHQGTWSKPRKNPFISGFSGLWEIYGDDAKKAYLEVVKGGSRGMSHFDVADKIGVQPWRAQVLLEDLSREGIVYEAGGKWYKA